MPGLGMGNLYEAFGTLNLNDPRVRRDVFVDGAQEYNMDVALFLLCSWDLLVNGATQAKIAGMERVFLDFNAPLEINVRGSDRRQALTMMRGIDNRGPVQQIANAQVSGVSGGRQVQSGRILVALGIAFQSMKENGVVLERWVANVADGTFGKTMLLGRRVPKESRTALSKLSGYWTDAEMRVLTGA